MTTVTVRIPTPLRRFTDGANEVDVEGRNVGEVLSALAQQYQDLVNRILTEDGTVRQFVTIYLGSEDVRNLEGMDTSVSEGDVLSIIPAVAGGAG
jgi:MoaD family protein